MAAAAGITKSLQKQQRDAVLPASRGGEHQGLPQFVALALLSFQGFAMCSRETAARCTGAAAFGDSS